jgi:hypothetical protein
MATHPPETIPSRSAAAGTGAPAADALTDAFGALHEQAVALARMAHIGAEPAAPRARIDALIARAAPWQRLLVARSVADNAAMLDAGLAALATLARRGQDTAAPALALWREYHAARAAMLSVLGPAEAA